MATPGMRELLCMGKLWELAQLERRTRDAAPYDLVIVDAPASGHGVGDPAHAAHLRRDRPRRPDREPGAAIAQTIADPAFTAVVAVTHAEEMPVNETLAAARRARLGPDRLTLEAVVLNGRHPDRFTPRIDVAGLTHHGGARRCASRSPNTRARTRERRAGSSACATRSGSDC